MVTYTAAPDAAIIGECKFDTTPRRCYRLHCQLIPEQDGGFSCVALNLPGVASCGETAMDAVKNTKEAAAGAIESYAADGVEVPLLESYDVPDGYMTVWFVLYDSNRE